MRRVRAVGEVLGALDHDVQRRGEGLAAARAQQGHARRLDQTLELLQRWEHGAAVPVLLLRALRDEWVSECVREATRDWLWMDREADYAVSTISRRGFGTAG